MTVDGDVRITGQGNVLASGSFNYGVNVLSGGQVKSTGVGASAGKIVIAGTGGGTGASGSNQNQGVRLDGSSVVVSSVDGSRPIRLRTECG
jgi:hypothetical protein